MIKLEFKTDHEAYEYCMLIIKDMIASFNITEEEAVGRMNSEWGHIEKIDKDDVMFHEEPDYWARKIYYFIGAEVAKGIVELKNGVKKLE